MGLTGTRTFVGFGFGAIQAGLFLHEALLSGAFARLVIAEIVPEVVAELRFSGGYYALNIAHSEGIEQVRIGPVEIANPTVAADRQQLIDAIAGAEEIATAVPSVQQYATDGPGSLHRVLAEGLARKAVVGGPRAVIYAAENSNRAASILTDQVLSALPETQRPGIQKSVCFLNTVIGKMSGVHSATVDLVPVVPGSPRAFLVEAFNHILIERVRFDTTSSAPVFRRGIQAFEEKEKLQPFEEAKLYGHNAVHALAAYIGATLGIERISDLRHLPGIMAFLRSALVDESGGALLYKYAGIDPFFTPRGYTGAADDLLERMVNPYLQDTVARVGRDPGRKLGWSDRLVGAIRLALAADIEPPRYAMGVAAALAMMNAAESPAQLLPPLWRVEQPDPDEVSVVLHHIEQGCCRLTQWRNAGCPQLEA